MRIDRNLHALLVASKFKDEVGLYHEDGPPRKKLKKPRKKLARYLNQMALRSQSMPTTKSFTFLT